MNMKSTDIIAFIGVIGSGKDHRARQLVDLNYRRIDFKDDLLDLASDIAGYDVREEYDWFKENPVGLRRPSNQLSEAMARSQVKKMLCRWPELMTGRRLLTRLGTEGMRKRDDGYWVDRFVLAAKPVLAAGMSVVVADCRFANEIETINRIGCRASFVFCDYRSNRYDSSLPHASERLAQAMLTLGLKDGEEIGQDHLARAVAIATPLLEKK